MADKVTSTKSDAPPDLNADVNAALDAAAKAMVASGMSEAQAEAFLNAARPNGTSSVVGNLADLQRSTGLPNVVVERPPTINEDRLAFAPKVEADPTPPPPQSTF